VTAIRVSGSFRDPAGEVYEHEREIYRTVRERARAAYEAARDRGIIADAVARGYLIQSDEVERAGWLETLGDVAYLIRHPRIPFISYPYEWCFSQLKAAALHHLDFQIFLLERGFVLSDASSYNIQFVGPTPVFIDLLSIQPYVEGEIWQGHRQFCEQFLNPLLLHSALGIAHNAWFRGTLEGISTVDLARIIPNRSKLSWNVLSQVVLQAKLEHWAVQRPDQAAKQAKSRRRLSRAGYSGMLRTLRGWIDKLRPLDTGKTIWGEYATTHTYSDAEAEAKSRFVREFAARAKPDRLIDLGCNTGDYSAAAIHGGAGYVVGFDFDHRALETAYDRARVEDLPYLPLWLDAANPSPDQGWRQAERPGFAARAKADAVIALAFEHHLAIAKNAPLPQVVDWIVDVAPQGVIEFVPKADETVQKMLALRQDIFSEYDIAHFAEALSARARIVREQVVSKSGRTLFQFDRS
jgi:ribosomal protein L11 methylase PrmA